MTDVVVPLVATPAQTVSVELGGQACTISVYQKRTGLYLNLAVNDAPVVSGVICLNNTLIVRDAYHGFLGDLRFWDTQGSTDPDYTGLGDRFVLLYTS